MSVQATTWVWDHSTATGSDLLVLLAVADAANAQGGRSCQSVKTIASMSRVATRTVHRSLRKLEDTGQIVRAGVAHEYAGTIIYELPGVVLGGPVTAPDPAPNQGGDNLTPPSETVAGGDICDAQGVTSATQGGDTDVTQPQFPSGTPQKDNPRGAKPPRKGPMQATRIPENWQPTPDDVQVMRDETGAADDVLIAETRKFVDWAHSAPDSKGKKVNWSAAWRNWIRRAAEQARERQQRDTYVPGWQRRLDANLGAVQQRHAQQVELAPGAAESIFRLNR